MKDNAQSPAAGKERPGNTTGAPPSGKSRSSLNALKHGLSVRQRATVQNLREVKDLADSIAGTAPSFARRNAALELAEAEIEYRGLQQYKLAVIDAEIDKARLLDNRPDEDARAEARKDFELTLRVIQVIEKYDRYDVPRWNQLRRALSRYELV